MGKKIKRNVVCVCVYLACDMTCGADNYAWGRISSAMWCTYLCHARVVMFVGIVESLCDDAIGER